MCEIIIVLKNKYINKPLSDTAKANADKASYTIRQIKIGMFKKKTKKNTPLSKIRLIDRIGAYLQF